MSTIEKMEDMQIAEAIKKMELILPRLKELPLDEQQNVLFNVTMGAVKSLDALKRFCDCIGTQWMLDRELTYVYTAYSSGVSSLASCRKGVLGVQHVETKPIDISFLNEPCES